MSGPIRFDPAVMYQFKVDTSGDYRGIRSCGTGHSLAFNRMAKVVTGVRVFAGARQNPFYFDTPQFSKLISDLNHKKQANPPAPSATCLRKPGVDFLRDYNVLSLVAEVPRAMLAPPGGKLAVIHVYATTSLRSPGASQYPQVERLGRSRNQRGFRGIQQSRSQQSRFSMGRRYNGIVDSVVPCPQQNPRCGTFAATRAEKPLHAPMK